MIYPSSIIYLDGIPTVFFYIAPSLQVDMLTALLFNESSLVLPCAAGSSSAAANMHKMPTEPGPSTVKQCCGAGGIT
jgi:hypothetical protein